MAEPGREGLGRLTIRGPQEWVFALFLFFGAAQLIAGVVYFFAFNWRDLPDPAKIALPQMVMAAGFLGWAVFGARSRPGAIAGILATVMIGVAMGVVGQVYQLGADPWRLFALWAALALPLSIIARNDAHFAVWFLIASVAYFLYADDQLRPLLPQRHDDSLIVSIFAFGALGVLALRELAADGAPKWQRWLFAAAALGAVLAGAIGELFDGRKLFANGFAASLFLFVLSAALLFIYKFRRFDKPTIALALFSVAAWFAAIGLHTLTTGTMNNAIGVSIAFFLSALWIVAVTAGFAVVLRRVAGDEASS